MEFSDKLNYLFELSHAEGKELALAMSVTPPQISKMRRGGRGLPRNRESAETLALFFARRCNSDFQREALSKKLRVVQVRHLEKDSELADVLLDWLSDEKDPDVYAAQRADDFLRQFGTLTSGGAAGTADLDPMKLLGYGQSSFTAYYGNSGKRLAVESFLKFISQRKHPCTINLLTDEPLDWLFEDAAFSRRFHKSMINLTEQGCDFIRISGPILNMDQAFESLQRWFPMYMTGKATSYYYKRMRDTLNRITIFVVPETVVMFSFSVGPLPSEENVTFLTVDERTVAAMAAKFNKYLSMCAPIMNVYSMDTSPRRMHECMLNYESIKGNCMQQNNSLSFITLPWDIAMSLTCFGSPDDKESFLTSFAQRFKHFTANLDDYSFTDIITLADFDAIMEKSVPIPGALVLGNIVQYYTPGSYLLHLRAILYLLEHRSNYHVVLRELNDSDKTVVYVKEGHVAILAMAAAPFSTFEVSERYLVEAFEEYLRRRILISRDDASYRRTVIEELKALIEQIEEALRQA